MCCVFESIRAGIVYKPKPYFLRVYRGGDDESPRCEGSFQDVPQRFAQAIGDISATFLDTREYFGLKIMAKTVSECCLHPASTVFLNAVTSGYRQLLIGLTAKGVCH